MREEWGVSQDLADVGESGLLSFYKTKFQVLFTVKSNQSSGSQEKLKLTRSSARGNTKKEENVFAYNNIPPLQYSPRRRV